MHKKIRAQIFSLYAFKSALKCADHMRERLTITWNQLLVLRKNNSLCLYFEHEIYTCSKQFNLNLSFAKKITYVHINYKASIKSGTRYSEGYEDSLVSGRWIWIITFVVWLSQLFKVEDMNVKPFFNYYAETFNFDPLILYQFSNWFCFSSSISIFWSQSAHEVPIHLKIGVGEGFGYFERDFLNTK